MGGRGQRERRKKTTLCPANGGITVSLIQSDIFSSEQSAIKQVMFLEKNGKKLEDC